VRYIWCTGSAYCAFPLSSPLCLFAFTSRRVLTRRPPPCTSTHRTRPWQEVPEDKGGCGHILSGRSDIAQVDYFTVYFFDPCFRVLLAWE